MLTLIQFFVYVLVIPLVFIVVLAFSGMLLIRATTLIDRWRALAAALAGLLISSIIILIDEFFGGLFSKIAPLESLEQVWPAAIIMAIIGFLFLFIVDLILKKGGAPFVILFSIVGVVVSAYYLLTLTQLRTLTVISAIGFVIGILIYLMMFPNNLLQHIQSYDEVS